MSFIKRKEIFPGRVRRLRKGMREHALEAMVITSGQDVRYLTGFSGHDIVLVLSLRRNVLVTDSRYAEQIRCECPGLLVRVRKGPMAQEVARLLGNCETVGLNPDVLTVSQYKAYRKAIGKGVRTVSGLVQSLRLCKDSFEVGQIRKAVRIAEQSLESVLGWLRIGMTEKEVAARLDYEMARGGSEAPAFDSIVAWGAHAAQPHAQAGRGRLGRASSMLFDWGATVGGYRSDLTRCTCTGTIRPAFFEAYQWVLEAQLRAVEEIRPGVSLGQVDQAARNILRKHKGCYEHGTGHGIGLEVHELPVIANGNRIELKEGMVVTVEPALYVPGKFGIRIEDDVLVTKKGCQVLSKISKSLETIL